MRSTCTGVWLRSESGGLQKGHMQTYLYVMVINNKRQGDLFQNIEDSSCVDSITTLGLRCIPLVKHRYG